MLCVKYFFEQCLKVGNEKLKAVKKKKVVEFVPYAMLRSVEYTRWDLVSALYC